MAQCLLLFLNHEGRLQAVCEDMEPLKFEYVHNLSMLMGEHQREELDEYIMSGVRSSNFIPKVQTCVEVSIVGAMWA